MKRKVRQHKFWVLLGILLVVIGSNGLLFERFFQPGFSRNNTDKVFVPGGGINYEEAQDIYKQAGKALADHHPGDALALYDKIEDAYVRLRPLILLHQAEAYAEQGNEAQAQSQLKTVTQEYPDTPFASMALYKTGQSQMRARQYDEAKESLETLIKKSPKSNLTIGGHYYLGEIAKENGDSKALLEHWRAYLQDSPDGTFSLAVAKGLHSTSYPKEPVDHQWIGLALYHQEHWREAIGHLEKAPFGAAWVELGKTYLRMGRKSQGLQVLEKGLHMTGAPDRAQEAIKAILSAYPSGSQKVAKLQQMLKTQPKTGGDFMLWELRKLSSGGVRAAYGQQLLDRYPQSNWAPETSWELMWPLYTRGEKAQFLERADAHLKRYPTSISAPRVLFWKAKLFLAQGKTDIAKSLLQTLTEQYPYQYYAFRAQQVLNGESKPWTTTPDTSYPPQPRINQDAEALARLTGNNDLELVVTELIRIQSPHDILMVLQSQYTDNLPVPLVSVAHQQLEEYPQSIRKIRDYLDEKRKTGNMSKDMAIYRLLYPALYTDEIANYAKRNHLDPFLVQALMRQESYFNPFAVSSSKAMGLMQLLPTTAQDVAKWEHMSNFTVASLFSPSVNIQLGTRYLRYLHDRFNGNSMQAVGGYNGGPGAMSRWSNGSSAFHTDPDLFIESIPYAQTRDYIKEVFSHYWNYRLLYIS